MKIKHEYAETYSYKINKELVHKQNTENVIISEPLKRDGHWYFTMFNQIAEFNFDHPSEHIQGMLIIEAARQSSIATTHLAGLPLEGVITLRQFNINFIDFMQKDRPVIIKTFSEPVILNRGKFFQSVSVSFMQNDDVKATAIVEGMSFESEAVVTRYLSIFNKRKNK